ncbi:hypothetical protein IFR05_001654 [Cadophora sp. M221]|nr:hypothetical protein IFR05_001654 [Cadophora sp. M221]
MSLNFLSAIRIDSTIAPYIIGVVGLFAFFAFRLRQRSYEVVKDNTTTAKSPFSNEFPPSRRAFANLPAHNEKDSWRKSSSDLRTVTGFTKSDVAAIGRFPDYAVLSGVPHPKPAPNFDIHKALFRPFRPFRWAYHQTMAFGKIDPNYWIELEQNYFERMAERQKLLEEQGPKVLDAGEGDLADMVCRELMEMVVQNICIRYPQYFTLKNKRYLENKLLSTTTDTETVSPLMVLFNNVPEDFAIALRHDDGYYYLRCGITCSAIAWNISTMKNKSLIEIHGRVGDYKEKMAKSMDRFFCKVPTDQAIQRGSWSIEDWKMLFLEEENYAARSRFVDKPGKLTAEDCFLRVDWQTLRRLPLSGAMVFNFKAVFTPLGELREEPYVPALLHKQLKEGKEILVSWRTHSDARRVVLDGLESWAREQVSASVVPVDWEVSTLAEAPFYPGWKERWIARQGFE